MGERELKGEGPAGWTGQWGRVGLLQELTQEDSSILSGSTDRGGSVSLSWRWPC